MCYHIFMNKEIWKPVQEAPLYYVSSYGRVKNTRSNKILQAWTNSSGYYQVGLQNDFGRRIHKTVHRLVAETFISNPNSHPVVNHRLPNKANCEVSNLEWCTVAQNNEHAELHGRQKTRPVVAYMGDVMHIFKSIGAASRSLDICRRSIGCCCFGKTKTSGGYYWRYI